MQMFPWNPSNDILGECADIIAGRLEDVVTGSRVLYEGGEVCLIFQKSKPLTYKHDDKGY